MKGEYKELRSRLEEERKRLTAELDQLLAGAHPSDERREGSPFGKREEEATETSELEKRLAMEKSTRDQMTAVEHALEKFEQGTYGLCDKCGKPIALERLDALPQASMCLECKSKESKGRPAPA